jgi:hypothetical protein
MDRTLLIGLGMTQILAHGILYYGVTALAPQISGDLGVSQQIVFSAISISLGISAVVSIPAGRAARRIGPLRVMCIASLAAAAGLIGVALAHTLTAFAVSLALIQTAAAGLSYELAVLSLSDNNAASLDRQAGRLALLSGVTPSLAWFSTDALLHILTWRLVLATYALVLILLAAPACGWLAWRQGQSTRTRPSDRTSRVAAAAPHCLGQSSMAILMLALGTTTLVLSSVSSQMLTVLAASGYSQNAAMIAAAFGPGQVMASLLIVAARPKGCYWLIACLSVGALIAACVLLVISRGSALAAIGFATLLGFGAAFHVVSRGLLPLEVFGLEDSSARLSAIACSRLAVAALSPAAFAWLASAVGITVALEMLIGLGVLALLLLLLLRIMYPPGSSPSGHGALPR